MERVLNAEFRQSGLRSIKSTQKHSFWRVVFVYIKHYDGSDLSAYRQEDPTVGRQVIISGKLRHDDRKYWY